MDMEMVGWGAAATVLCAEIVHPTTAHVQTPYIRTE